MSIYLNKDSKVIVQGITGGEGTKHTALMLKAGTQVVGGVNARKAGTTVAHKAAAGADRPFRYQRKLMDGGTCEATVLTRVGYGVGAVALPLKNYHNAGRNGLRPEIIDLDDAVWLVELLVGVASSTSPPRPVSSARRSAGPTAGPRRGSTT